MTSSPAGTAEPSSLRRGRRQRAAWRADAGVATVLAVVCLVSLLVVTGAVVQFGAAMLARHRAEVAADLAALAAASVLLGGRDRACAAAETYARSNGAQLLSCEQDSLDVRLQVRVRVRAGPLVGSAVGRARAGPAVTTAPDG
jgi:secretion/DNA translocation related TadE-like protein